MALVNIDSVLRILLQRLEKLNPGQGIELLSYKRNRSVAVLLQNDGKVMVREQGYRDNEELIERPLLSKYLKSLIKHEFPRSRKVRMYQVGDPGELEKTRKKL